MQLMWFRGRECSFFLPEGTPLSAAFHCTSSQQVDGGYLVTGYYTGMCQRARL